MVGKFQSLPTLRDAIFATGDVKLIIHFFYAYTKYDELNPTNIYLFSVDSRSTRKRCEICSKLGIKLPERHQ